MVSFAMERGKWSNLTVSCFERGNSNEGILGLHERYKDCGFIYISSLRRLLQLYIIFLRL